MWGIDAGYGWTKIVGPMTLKFPSIVGRARARNLVTEHSTLLDELHVDVDGQEWFVGELARREAVDASIVLDRERLDTTRLLVLVALACATRDAVNIVTGLPVARFRGERDILRKALEGEHVVRFLAGEPKTVRLRVDRCLVFPQAAGALFSMLLDDVGKPVGSGLASRKIACLDIGYRTTDYIVMDSMRYLDQRSGSLPIGIVDAQLALVKRLNEQGRECTLTEVEGFISDSPPEYQALARKIMNNVQRHIGDAELFIAGGGGAALARWLQGQVIPDPQFANARGFYRVGLARL